jgi:hypothetical protein
MRGSAGEGAWHRPAIPSVTTAAVTGADHRGCEAAIQVVMRDSQLSTCDGDERGMAPATGTTVIVLRPVMLVPRSIIL